MIIKIIMQQVIFRFINQIMHKSNERINEY